MFYSNLEPNHTVKVLDDVQVVVCPFEDENGEGFETPWSLNADPAEVNCLFCEHLNGDYPLSPDHCDGDATTPHPPISGGAHGGIHHVTEYSACRVPLRRIIWCDATLVVHEGAVASLGRIEARWRARGGHGAYRIRREDTGAYNCRRTTSGNSMSKHSWGCAVDINWRTNPYGSRLVTDMPGWFVQLFRDEGWGWGGAWSGAKDAMHHSKFPSEGGDGRLYVGSTPTPTPTPQPIPNLEDEMKVMYLLKATGSGAVWLCPDLDYRQVLGSMSELNAIKDATVKAGGKVTEIIEVSQEFLQAIRPRV